MSTDYAAESNRIADHLGENVIALEGQTDATMIATALDALRFATLHAAEQTAALVKQQRIANLIALGETHVIDPGDDSPYPVTKMRDNIREGLGLA